MEKDEKTQIEQNRKEFSIQSMYFNRYLLVRYISALFFFTNLYWMISLLISNSSLYIIPLILMSGLLFSIAEQVKIYSNHTNDAKYTKYSYVMLIFTNIVLIILTCFSSTFTQLYPFLLNQEKSKILVLIILVVGILLCTLILYRLNKIKHNDDKHYERIRNYEKIVN